MLGSRKRDVDSSLVCQEANLSLGISSDRRNNDDVSLLSLEWVDSVDHHFSLEDLAIGRVIVEVFVAISYDSFSLGLIRSDKAKRNALINQATDQ